MLARGLDLLLKEVPGEEAQRETALGAQTMAEQVDRVDDLGAGDVDVDGAEVLGQAVADEHDAQVEQEPEFLVRDFEADQVVAARAAVEVAGRNPGVGGQVVDDGLGDGDVVVDEGQAFVRAGAAEDGDAGEPETRRAHRFARPVRFDVDFGFGEGDEFGVDGAGGAGLGGLGVLAQYAEDVWVWLWVWAAGEVVEECRVEVLLPGIFDVVGGGFDLVG